MAKVVTRGALDEATFDLAVISEIMVTLAASAVNTNDMVPRRG